MSLFVRSSIPSFVPTLASCLLLVAPLVLGCGKRMLTERDTALCIRAGELKRLSVPVSRYALLEKYDFKHSGRKNWSVGYSGQAFDSRTNLVFTLRFRARASSSVAELLETAKNEAGRTQGAIPATDLVSHMPQAYAFQIVHDQQTNGTMMGWIESGKVFTLETDQIAIRSPQDFTMLTEDKTGLWSSWDPGSPPPKPR